MTRSPGYPPGSLGKPPLFECGDRSLVSALGEHTHSGEGLGRVDAVEPFHATGDLEADGGAGADLLATDRNQFRLGLLEDPRTSFLYPGSLVLTLFRPCTKVSEATAPSPMMTRPAMSQLTFEAVAATTEPAQNTATPVSMTFLRPSTSPSVPPANMKAAKVNAYPLTTHCSEVMPAWRPL